MSFGSSPLLIILDFDGTVLESVDIKTEAFRELFDSYPERLDEIMAYHLRHNGISRFVKFKYIYEEILVVPFDDRLREDAARRFSAAVFQRVVECPLVAGAENFLKRVTLRLPTFLVSASPEEELIRVVTARGLAGHFRGVFGSPTAKLEHARRILAREAVSPHAAVYIGDSVEDYRVAQELEIPFIGRRNKETLEEIQGPVYPDLVGVEAEISARLAKR